MLLSSRVLPGESKAVHVQTIPHPEDLGSIPALTKIPTAEVFLSKALKQWLALNLDGGKLRETTKYDSVKL